MVQGVLTANKVQTFSIHCWSDEIDEINHALLYGSIQDSDWAYGAIISGKITPSFIDLFSLTSLLRVLKQVHMKK